MSEQQGTVRVYLPATFSMLGDLARDGKIAVPSGVGFALTPALREFFTAGDDEEIEYHAFLEASRASLRLLSAGGEEKFPHRRVVVSADLPAESVTPAPEKGDAVVELSPAELEVGQLAAVHVDDSGNEAATAAAVEVVDAADLGDEDAEITLGDCEDNLMSWYDARELGVLVELL
ncbi:MULTISPECIES: DUF6912 family protein [Corynebacterium]|jgi:hypothetical protein|uniref:Uncharacterized protein n=1 Tax=Corynebacterium provencense TaxID=1737425 RepID=A0A2Z3YM00_9CORY|nr:MULTISPECIES: hypothetical protein [Corynebacterium]AWT25605.1 hypothetical protein Csp1_07960 [Corynebacterium provencense]MCI1256366.1 hypothetical protein [Corynebacterium provencense]